MACEIDVVVSKTFRCNESSISIHHFYGMAYTTGYIEFLSIDLRRSYKYNAAKVNFRTSFSSLAAVRQ